jgi:hypothetical protein
MAYRWSMMAWGLCLVAMGCGGEPADAGSDEGGGSTAGSTVSEGGAHDVDDGGLPPAGTTTTGPGSSSTSSPGDSSGSVEDTIFGMSDDMPLVADIPDIKRGLWAVGSWVAIEQVLPTTGRAELEGDQWFYVQDPSAEEHMGLRVALQPGDAMPAEDQWVDLVGFVVHDEPQGFMLELDTSVELGSHPGVPVRRVRVSTLVSPDAPILDDSVVDVAEPSALVVTRQGPVPGTVLVGAVLGSSGALLVDLRPFGLQAAEPPAGTQLLRLRGVVEIGGVRPVILPRSTDDLVVAG